MNLLDRRRFLSLAGAAGTARGRYSFTRSLYQFPKTLTYFFAGSRVEPDAAMRYETYGFQIIEPQNT